MKKFLLGLLLLSILGFTTWFYFWPQEQDNDELIIVVHGLARSDNAMWLMERRFEQQGYQVCLLDYQTINTEVDTIFDDTQRQIDACLSDKKTHFVGHSLGGLMIKHYLNLDHNRTKIQKMGEVVFVGTPNHGSEVADALKGHYLMQFGGEVAQSLMTGLDTLGEQMGENKIPVGVIAGTKASPLTEKYFTQVNDGLVSVESTRLANMKDFITLEVSHSAMRYNDEVMSQIMHFLNHGQFKR